MTELVTTQEMELVAQFEVTAELIADLHAKFADVSFDTPANYEVGRLALGTLRGYRLKIEKVRVDAKAEVLERGRLIDKTARKFSKPIEEIEDRLAAAKKVVDDAEAKRKLDAERAELIALEAQQKAEREAAEAKGKAERAADEQRIAAAAAKLAADQARADEANKAIAEQQRQERERLDAEKAQLEAKQREIDEQTRKANEVAAERQRQEQAEAKRIADEAAAVVEAARLAEMRPDIEKVRGFANEIRALAAQAPTLTAPPCVQAMEWVTGHLAEMAQDLEAFDGK